MRRELIDALRTELRGAGTPDRAVNEKRYLKSDLAFWGASVPAIRKATKRLLRSAGDLDHDAVRALVSDLWGERVHEMRRAAVEVAVLRVDRLILDDVSWVETMIRESGTWAYVDPLAIDVAGPLLARSPGGEAVLDRWATDGDFWIRRSALLTHLRPLRAGGGDWARFTRYADAMLGESEFFIRKAVGWVLRDAAKARPDLVYRWLLPRADRASGVTVREAVRPLSGDRADEVMARYRNR